MLLPGPLPAFPREEDHEAKDCLCFYSGGMKRSVRYKSNIGRHGSEVAREVGPWLSRATMKTVESLTGY